MFINKEIINKDFSKQCKTVLDWAPSRKQRTRACIQVIYFERQTQGIVVRDKEEWTEKKNQIQTCIIKPGRMGNWSWSDWGPLRNQNVPFWIVSLRDKIGEHLPTVFHPPLVKVFPWGLISSHFQVCLCSRVKWVPTGFPHGVWEATGHKQKYMVQLKQVPSATTMPWLD